MGYRDYDYEERKNRLAQELDELDRKEAEQRKRLVKYISIGVVAFVVLNILLSSTVTIQAGHTGVVSTFGKVSSTVLSEGFHFKAPWQRITKVDNRVIKYEVETETSSKDSQKITSTITINYRISPDKSYSIIKNIGQDYESIVINPNVNEAFKVITAGYTADECVVNRDEVAIKTKDKINELLGEYGITVNSINIDNTFDKSYQKAINDKQVAEQKLKKAKIEKEAAVVNAEAEAQEKQIAAEAEAKAIKIKADAEAEANKKLNASLSKSVIQYSYIQKWDGQMPKVTGGSGTIVDIGDELSKDKQ